LLCWCCKFNIFLILTESYGLPSERKETSEKEKKMAS